MKKFIPPLLWIAVYQAMGIAIGSATREGTQGWYQDLQKSSLNPPDFIFPIVWTILYVLIALAGWRIWMARDRAGMKPVLAMFGVYTLLNWTWSFVFFAYGMVFWALVSIETMNVLALLMIWFSWRRGERPAALFMVLPTIWTCFAAYLNYAILVLNPGFWP